MSEHWLVSRDADGQVICHHGRSFTCPECGEEYAAELAGEAEPPADEGAQETRTYTQAELNEAVQLAIERTIQNVREGRIFSPERAVLVERLTFAAASYRVTADGLLGGGAVWAGAQHYLEVAEMLEKAAAALKGETGDGK